MSLGDRLDVLGGQICQFQTYGDVMIDFWSSSIVIGFYTYAGLGSDCVIDGEEQYYTSQTLLQTKKKPDGDGKCSYLFYIQNTDENGNSFTVDIFRNSASFLGSITLALGATVALLF